MVQTDYNLQATRLRALHERFNRAPIVAEYNSMGGPQVEALQLLAEVLDGLRLPVGQRAP